MVDIGFGTPVGGAGMATIGLFVGLFFCLGVMSVGWLFKSLPIMMGGTITWIGVGAYAFSTSATQWDVYYIMGALSMAMAVVCLFVSIAQKTARDAEARAKVKIEVQQPKTYGDRYADWEKKTGAKTREQRDADAESNMERKLRKRLT